MALLTGFMLVFCGVGFAQGSAWMSATDDMPAAFIKAEDGPLFKSGAVFGFLIF
jgi:hypothetical protein